MATRDAVAARDAVGALGRLLSDPALLALYARDPEAAADALAVRAVDRAEFVSWDATALCSQASGLVDKRRHEVRRWLPRTCAGLGGREAALFAEFAAGYWPTGHRRHAEDALAFWRFLRARRERAARPEEKMRLAVMLGKFPFALRVIPDFVSRSGSRVALLLVWRWRGAVRHFAWYRVSRENDG